MGSADRGPSSWGTDTLKDFHEDEVAGVTEGTSPRRRPGRQGWGIRNGSAGASQQKAYRIEWSRAMGTEDAVVTHLRAAAREHVLEGAIEELHGGDRAVLNRLRPGVAVVEGDAPLFETLQPVVGQGDAENITAEILENVFS